MMLVVYHSEPTYTFLKFIHILREDKIHILNVTECVETSMCNKHDLFLHTKWRTKSKGSKNISNKMLKDVGMTVPRSRETSAVYMQQDRG